MYSKIAQAHRSYIQRECVAGSLVNVLLCALSTVLVFRQATRIPLWGAGGIAADLVPTVFMLTLIGGIVMTLMSRFRLRRQAVAPMADRACGTLARVLPRQALLRVVILALTVTITVVPLTVLVMWLLGVDGLPFSGYLVFKMAYGPAVGMLSVRAVVESALREHPAAVKAAA